MARAEPAPVLRVEIVYCQRPGATDRVALELPLGATVADALRVSGIAERHALAAERLSVGVWSKVRDPAAPLRDGDRVEVYRPLTVDPKEARRLRYRRHKERASGG